MNSRPMSFQIVVLIVALINDDQRLVDHNATYGDVYNPRDVSYFTNLGFHQRSVDQPCLDSFLATPFMFLMSPASYP